MLECCFIDTFSTGMGVSEKYINISIFSQRERKNINSISIWARSSVFFLYCLLSNLLCTLCYLIDTICCQFLFIILINWLKFVKLRDRYSFFLWVYEKSIHRTEHLISIIVGHINMNQLHYKTSSMDKHFMHHAFFFYIFFHLILKII